jgi:hypothetical protein
VFDILDHGRHIRRIPTLRLMFHWSLSWDYWHGNGRHSGISFDSHQERGRVPCEARSCSVPGGTLCENETALEISNLVWEITCFFDGNICVVDTQRNGMCTPSRPKSTNNRLVRERPWYNLEVR